MPVTRLRTIPATSAYASGLTSPAACTRPVVAMDFKATLALGSGQSAGMAVESGGRGVVADAGDEAAHDSGDIGVGVGVDLAGDVHEAGGDHGLHGDLGVGVLPQQVVEHRITDLVADLVGMSLGDGLG